MDGYTAASQNRDLQYSGDGNYISPDALSIWRSNANLYTGGEMLYDDAVFNARIGSLLYRLEKRAYRRDRARLTPVEYLRAQRLHQAVRKQVAADYQHEDEEYTPPVGYED